MKLVIATFLIAISLNSCNTTIGLARDMRQAGEGLEKAAQGKQGDGGGEARRLRPGLPLSERVPSVRADPRIRISETT